MAKIRKYANSIERFLHGPGGQRFFNFAYSIGAAVVIWGALFKILHLPGGNTLLCIGMGTEIAMFILTAFDRPPKEYAWEDVFPVLDSHNADERPDFSGAGGGMPQMTAYSHGHAPEGESIPVAANAAVPASPVPELSEEESQSLHDSILKMAQAADQLSRMADLTTATQDYISSISGIAEQMQQLRQTTTQLNQVSAVLLDSYKAITDNSATINESSTGYVAQMENLNRNIAGLNTIYEIQLKGISSQLDSIDRVNRGLKDIRDMYEKSAYESSRYCEETEKMARYMKQLNKVYEKMITAMTINMQRPMMGGAPDINPFEGGNS